MHDLKLLLRPEVRIYKSEMVFDSVVFCCVGEDYRVQCRLSGRC